MTECACDAAADHAQIADRLAVQDRLVAYGRAIDTVNQGALANCFTDDAIAEYSGTGELTGGGTRIAKLMISGVRRYHSSTHMITNFATHVEGEHAQLRAYGHARSVMRPPPSAAWVLLEGDYEVVLRKSNEQWLIRHLVFHCTWFSGQPDAIGWPGLEAHVPKRILS